NWQIGSRHKSFLLLYLLVSCWTSCVHFSHVIVVVTDVNDNAPMFASAKSLIIPEDTAPHSVVMTVHAEDEDSGSNGEVLYYLKTPSGGTFSIGNTSGNIYLEEALDREQVDTVTIIIIATDRGSPRLTSSMNLTMHIEDVNDNDPEFPQSTYSLTIGEDIPRGTSVFQLQAHDRDVGQNGEVWYMLNQTGPFVVDQLSGELIVDNPLDYENKKEFTLLIEARDSGSPPFSSFAEIHLNISDVNDNFPLFTQTEYRCEVLENSPPSWVCDVLAIDADSDSYGTVQYNITEGNTENCFTVDPESGLLSTTESLDREHISEFSLTVEATDIDNPLYKDKAIVIIVVLDRNDNAPRFSQIFFTKVSEDASIGHSIIQVTSNDDDIGVNAIINYSIIDQSDHIPFNINFTSGYITVERPLDREMQDLYILKVNANDSAWSISTDITIVVTDINDNKPVFSDNFYTVVLPETKEEDIFVMQVLAADADLGQNSEILYFIEPSNEEFWVNATTGNASDFFWIHSDNGKLILHQTLAESVNLRLTLIVVAKDQGTPSLSSQTEITFEITGRNQFPPLFKEPDVTFSVPEDLPIGSVIGKIQAEDADYGPNGAIMYCITPGNQYFPFSVGEASGLLTLMTELDFEKQGVYHLQIKAMDGGWASKTGVLNVTVVVMDVNDNPP
uniref:Cadherin domain-containing protein n=1 Tax=Anabas testudineus TaxID=64144 RepID=A0A7N6BII3_ANATE